MSVLEATYIVRLIPGWYGNINKRLVKAPKLHFVDTGLACALLGITADTMLETHPLRGAQHIGRLHHGEPVPGKQAPHQR
jgi:predicted AAA+ superfamily ATPase